MHVSVAQDPPFHASDDKIITVGNGVIMLDGASAFMPVPVPPGVYADALGAGLHQCLEAAPAADLVTVLADTIHEVAARLDLRPGHSPSSTVTILRAHDGWTDILMLGDNLAVLPGLTITDPRLSRLDLEPSRLYRRRLAHGSGFDQTHRALLHELQTQQAARRNRPGGYWIAEADPTAAQHAIVHRIRTDDALWAVLATDGAYKPMRHLGITDWTVISSVSAADLDAILKQCHAWEREHDPDARHLPRAKRHDDKALAIARST
ncbi:hypothetical protein [Amycolatopsis orientalis]|uniref:hypothetical protein n=1 Tax=Amycolatopsis orientalis TaxID=31958 RepID=UPI00042A134F|nr:hypothetical protein [Amycolatopsis orientalis]